MKNLQKQGKEPRKAQPAARYRWLGGLLSAALLLGAMSSARAERVVYATGFEPDQGFTVGPISGQGGWSGDGDVQAGIVEAGLQALHIDGSGTGFYGAWLPAQFHGQRYVTVRVEFRGDEVNAQAGLAVWGDTGFLTQFYSVRGVCTFGNFNSDTGFQPFAAGVWHELVLTLDFVDQNESATLDGIPMGTVAMNPPGGPATAVTGVSIYSFGAGAPNDIYADQLLISTSGTLSDVLYQTGFEPDQGFTVGPISGQGGWSGDGDVQAGIVEAGLQALHIDGSGTAAYGASAPIYFQITQRYATLRFEFRRDEVNAQAGLAVWGDTGFLAQIYTVDGHCVLGNASSGTPPQPFAAGVWHELVLTLDFDAQNESATLDGIPIGTIALNPPGGPATVVTGVSIYSFGAGAPNDIYVDQLSVSTDGTLSAFTGSAFNPCNGDLVSVFGTMQQVDKVTQNGSTFHVSQHLNINASGVGLPSGAIYPNANEEVNFELNIAKGQTLTSVLNLRLIGQGQTPNLVVHALYHVTVDANGNLTSAIDNFTVVCH